MNQRPGPKKHPGGVGELGNLRAAVRYRLIEDQGGGSLLGEQGSTEASLLDILHRKYGKRLQTVWSTETREVIYTKVRK